MKREVFFKTAERRFNVAPQKHNQSMQYNTIMENIDLDHYQGDDALRARVNALIESGVVTQNRLAQALDRSGAYLSQWRKNVFAQNARLTASALIKFEQMLRAAVEEIERQQGIGETRRERRFRFCKTAVADAVIRALRTAFENKEICVALSHWGVGKTRTVHWYSEQYPGRVLFVQAGERMTTKDLMMEIAEKCGVIPKGSIYKIRKAITEKLRNEQRIIVIDECEHLSPETIDEVRQINDQARVGICLIGLVRFKSAITTLRNSKYGYIYDRIKSFKSLPTTNITDAEMLVKNEFNNISKDLIRVMFECAHVSSSDGKSRCSYRRLETLVYKLVEFESQLSEKLIREAAEEMEG